MCVCEREEGDDEEEDEEEEEEEERHKGEEGMAKEEGEKLKHSPSFSLTRRARENRSS